MNPDAPIFHLIDFFSSPQNATLALQGFTKLAVLVAYGIYLIFGIVVIRQVTVMARTISTPIDSVLKLIAFLHLGLALLAFLWVLFAL